MTPRDTASQSPLVPVDGDHCRSGLRLLRSVRHETEHCSYEVEQHCGGGHMRWFLKRGDRYLNEDGNFVAATLAYARDFPSEAAACHAIAPHEAERFRPVAERSPEATTRPGLAIDYVFSDPTRDPFDECEWRWVDAEIKDEAGKAIFRQRVEVPAGWSDRAAQVVASKYFWGDADRGDDPRAGGREHSVRQLVGRVSRTLARLGAEDGYFATPLDAARFERELRWLCLNQYGAFNSPVWFNVGLADAYGLQGRPANWRWDAGAVVGSNGDRTIGAAVPADDLLKYAQASACFIQSVSDDMEGIMALATSEALLFKSGSGTGSDLSTLRSTREKLTGGGKPSGPVSFMRIYDAGAGVIKSGGRTRRSAKMQILRCDHPDIMEFVGCKVKEDRKARALIAAGYSAGMTGHPDEAYSSVYFQNSNLSVGVTDAFMERATSTDPDFRKWFTIAVTTGDPVETLDAGAVLDAVAAGTWECGDPGVEFLDTLNRWHTIPNTAPIRACNPCSEFVHVDDSACNLASLNLMKFRRADGTFDDERFRAAVRIFILAQEIIVDRASYPTKAICENSHRSRPLGLGYSNLGAFLMASGLPYNSDRARDLAGAITSIMTAEAYRLSAAVAAFKGPFVFFESNREPMLKVIGMHRDAAADLFNRACHPEALRLAVEAGLLWDGCRGLGERYGFRNSQVTLMAPCGTISFMMDCDTTGLEPELALVKYKNLAGGGQLKLVNGIVPTALRTLGYDGPEVREILDYIKEEGTIDGAPHLKPGDAPVFDCAFPARPGCPSIHWRGHVRMVAAIQPHISGASSKCVTADTVLTTDEGLIRIGSLHRGERPDSFRPHEIGVASVGGDRKTDAFYYGGYQPTVRVELRSGHAVICTPNHPLMVCNGSGLEWKQAGEIDEGDHVAVRYGADLWASDEVSLADFRPSDPYGNQKSVRFPTVLDADLSFLLGVFHADGNTTHENYTIVITKSEEAILERVASAWRDLFGVESRINHPIDRCPNVAVHSKAICEFFDYLGCRTGANNKRIPDLILRSPRHVVLSFLTGLFLDSYIHIGKVPKWGICLASTGMIDDISVILTNLGVVHGRTEKWNKKYGRFYHEINVNGDQAKALFGLIRFMEQHKAEAAALFLRMDFSQSTTDVIPGLAGRDLYEMIPKRGSKYDGHSLRRGYTSLLDSRTKNASRHSLERVAGIDGVFIPEWLRTILDDGLHFSPVVSVEDGGEREVFDISVPETHAFVGNGIVNHNTINMPESSTVEEIRDAYVEGWRLGVKAMAIYRDGSKGAQPIQVRPQAASVPVDSPGVPVAVSPAPDAVIDRPRRERLPATRQSVTRKIEISGHEGYAIVGLYPDGRPGELFLKLSRGGSTIDGLMDTIGILTSLCLQYGVPVEVLESKFVHTKFDPCGPTGDPEHPWATSLPDYIFSWMAREFGAGRSVSVGAGPVPLPAVFPAAVGSMAPIAGGAPVSTGPACPDCGAMMVPAGRCHRCLVCGYSGGCG